MSQWVGSQQKSLIDGCSTPLLKNGKRGGSEEQLYSQYVCFLRLFSAVRGRGEKVHLNFKHYVFT